MKSGADIKHLFVSLTQEQYDNLKDKDEDTLYFTENNKDNETNNEEIPEED